MNQERLNLQTWRRMIALALLAAVLLPISPATMAEPGSAASLLGWSRLTFTGRKYLVASASISLERYPQESGKPERVETRSSFSVFGAKGGERRTIVEQSLPDPAGATPTVWRSLEIVPAEKARLIEARADGCLAVLRYPLEPDRPIPPPEAWRPNRREAKRWVVPSEGTLSIEAYTLLAHLDRLLSAPRTTLFLTGKNGSVEVLAERSGTRHQRLSIEEGNSHRELTIESDQVGIRLSPKSDKGETILSLVGPTTLWIDVVSGALVEIEGRHEERGQIRLSLTSASLSGTPRQSVAWPSAGVPVDVCPPAP